MFVKAIQCEKCGDVVYSRHRHDMRWCSCGNVAIDGGIEYARISWKSGEQPVLLDVDIGDVSIEQLEADYTRNANKYRII